MSELLTLIASAARHPATAVLGAREFRGSVGMSYDCESRCEAYDAGRELAHAATGRRWEQ